MSISVDFGIVNSRGYMKMWDKINLKNIKRYQLFMQIRIMLQ